jgi:hypothetical protein
MHQPIQPKNLSWWEEVCNSTYIIFQHSPARRASLGSQTWNRSEQQLFYLIALARIQTHDIWLWYHIKLHAPTNSTQKLKLMGRGVQFTYIIFQQRCLPSKFNPYHMLKSMHMKIRRHTFQNKIILQTNIELCISHGQFRSARWTNRCNWYS